MVVALCVLEGLGLWVGGYLAILWPGWGWYNMGFVFVCLGFVVLVWVGVGH